MRQTIGEGRDSGRSGEVLRSSELAELAGTTTRALRHYHQIGLLPEVPRDPNGYRRYSARDLVTVIRIRQFAASGMPLRRIAEVLQRSDQSFEEVLDELDGELEKQMESIRQQRDALVRLRRTSGPPDGFSAGGRRTSTQRLDQDIWTLVTGTGGVEAEAAATVSGLLATGEMAERIAAWYPEFERMEDASDIDDDTANRLAQRIADFAHAMWSAAGFTPTTERYPVMEWAEQLQSETLSPAQKTVWSRFLALIGD